MNKCSKIFATFMLSASFITSVFAASEAVYDHEKKSLKAPTNAMSTEGILYLINDTAYDYMVYATFRPTGGRTENVIGRAGSDEDTIKYVLRDPDYEVCFDLSSPHGGFERYDIGCYSPREVDAVYLEPNEFGYNSADKPAKPKLRVSHK